MADASLFARRECSQALAGRQAERQAERKDKQKEKTSGKRAQAAHKKPARASQGTRGVFGDACRGAQ
jgi:hypothetical protein